MLKRVTSIGLVFSFLGVCPVAFANVTDDLKGYWSLDEGSGNSAVESVSGNNGTWQGAGPHYVNDGPNGGGASGIFTYDDEGHYVSIPDSPSYEFNTYFSLSMWVKATAWTPWNVLIAKDNWDAQEGWALYVSSESGGLGSLCYEAPVHGTICTDPIIPLSSWVHIVVTNDHGDAIIYVDGVQAADGSVPLQNSTVDLLIGARHNNDGTTYTDNFMGNISHVRLYKRALTTDDIETLHTERFPALRSSSSSASTVEQPRQSAGGSRGNSTKMIVEAMQKKIQMMQAHQAASSDPVEPKESMSPDLQMRACERVMKWFKTDAKMLGRVNERLQKRFGFMCQ